MKGVLRFPLVLGVVVLVFALVLWWTQRESPPDQPNCEGATWVGLDGWATAVCEGQLVVIDYERGRRVTRALLGEGQAIVGVGQGAAGVAFFVIRSDLGDSLFRIRRADRVSAPERISGRVRGLVVLRGQILEVATTTGIWRPNENERLVRVRYFTERQSGTLVQTSHEIDRWTQWWITRGDGEIRAVHLDENQEQVSEPQVLEPDDPILAKGDPIFASTGMLYFGIFESRTDANDWGDPGVGGCSRRFLVQRGGIVESFDRCPPHPHPIRDAKGRKVTPNPDLTSATVTEDGYTREIRLAPI